MAVTGTIDGRGTNAEVLAQHARLLDLMAAGAAGQALLDTVVCGLEELMPGSLCSILLVDDERRRLLHGSAPHLPEEYTRAVHRLQIGPVAGSCGTAAHLGRTVIVPDISIDPRWGDFREVALRSGLRSCWSRPITAPDGAVLGTFAVYHDTVHRPSAEDLSLLADFSHLAAIAIQHARLDRAVLVSEERFRRCFEFSAAGIAILGLDGRIIKINGALARMSGSEPAALTGLPVESLVSPAAAGAVREALDEVLLAPEGGAAERHLEVRLGQNEGARPALLSLGVARGPEGDPLCLCVNVSVVAGVPITAFGTITLDPVAREARRDGVLVELTRKEFDLLLFLVRHPRRVFRRSELLERVWDSCSDWQEEATVTQHVHRLRHRLEDDPSRPRWLLTVRGVGYRFDPSPR